MKIKVRTRKGSSPRWQEHGHTDTDVISYYVLVADGRRGFVRAGGNREYGHLSAARDAAKKLAKEAYLATRVERVVAVVRFDVLADTYMPEEDT